MTTTAVKYYCFSFNALKNISTPFILSPFLVLPDSMFFYCQSDECLCYVAIIDRPNYTDLFVVFNIFFYYKINLKLAAKMSPFYLFFINFRNGYKSICIMRVLLPNMLVIKTFFFFFAILNEY